MSPRSTRNSRNLITSRDSRPAWQIHTSPTRASRSGRTKRKCYRGESDGEEASDSDTPLTKKTKTIDLYSEGDDDLSLEEEDENSVMTPPSTVVANGDGEEVGEGGAGKIFKWLPLEIHAHIVNFLPRDADVVHYSTVCKRAKSAVDTFVWSKRYADVYDVEAEHEYGRDTSGKQVIIRYWHHIAAEEYRSRHISFTHKWLSFARRNMQFEQDDRGKEKLWELQMTFLQHFRNLIYESDARKLPNGSEVRMFGKNFDMIFKITDRDWKTDNKHCFDILEALLEHDKSTTAPRGKTTGEKTKFTTMVQLCLLPIILDLGHNSRGVCHWDSSQKVVYGLSQNMFDGQYKSRIKFDFFVNTLNFFKFHFKTGNGEGVLNEAYSKLQREHCPQLWYGKVPVGTQDMQGHWKGAWTYLSSRDITTMRSNYGSQESYQDTVDDEDSPFFDMTLFCDETKFNASHWPALWDAWVVSDPYSVFKNSKISSSNRPEVKHFWGTVRGSSKEGHIFGRNHAMSNQGSFHGWQHVSMILCFSDGQGAFDDDDVWVYEGIALPGNRIMMGRWSQATIDHESPDSYQCGPFMFWNVDESTAEPAFGPDETWEFTGTINNPMYSSLPVADILEREEELK